ncbi:hypothetical protein LXL04_019331 [Taraxacum kok-saghyz]
MATTISCPFFLKTIYPCIPTVRENAQDNFDIDHWKVIDALPSYGQGLDLACQRYLSLMMGESLSDVVITDDNGTIDGQGAIWWNSFDSNTLNHSRPHIVEFINSKDIVISNITFLNSSAWAIHPVGILTFRNVIVQNITAVSPIESTFTSGIVPHSSNAVCIGNSNITMGHDAISLKSEWDEYGSAYRKPTTNVHIKGVRLQLFRRSALALGSEMSGGDLGSSRGKRRGCYVKSVFISDVEFKNVLLRITLTGDSKFHPDEKYNPEAIPVA